MEPDKEREAHATLLLLGVMSGVMPDMPWPLVDLLGAMPGVMPAMPRPPLLYLLAGILSGVIPRPLLDLSSGMPGVMPIPLLDLLSIMPTIIPGMPRSLVDFLGVGVMPGMIPAIPRPPLELKTNVVQLRLRP